MFGYALYDASDMPFIPPRNLVKTFPEKLIKKGTLLPLPVSDPPLIPDCKTVLILRLIEWRLTANRQRIFLTDGTLQAALSPGVAAETRG